MNSYCYRYNTFYIVCQLSKLGMNWYITNWVYSLKLKIEFSYLVIRCILKYMEIKITIELGFISYYRMDTQVKNCAYTHVMFSVVYGALL
jgi:hypothetical protein